MIKTSTITWIDIKDARPLERGWYMVVLKPKNYDEFLSNPKEMNSWIKKFGIEKLWWNNGAFWKDNYRVNKQVNYWGYLPKVPIYE